MIPEGWQEIRLGDVGEFSKGKGIAKKDLSETGIPCVRYGELYTAHHFHIKNYHSFISTKVACESKKLSQGDILFAGSGETLEEIGKCASFLDSNEAYAGGDVIIMSPNQRKFNSAFLGYYLNSALVRRQTHRLGQGHSVVHIYAKDLKLIDVSLPPLSEQKRIATILSTCDEEIETLRQLAEARQRQKRGLMQQLLTGKRRLPGFRGAWQRVLFSEICQLSKDKYNPTSRQDIISSIELENIEQGKGTINGFSVVNELSSIKSTFKARDVLFGKLRPYLRKFYFAKENGVCSTEIWVIRSNSDVCLPQYLYLLVQTEKFLSIANKTSGTKMPRSDWKIVKDSIFPLPPLAEQKRIAAILSTCDEEIETLRQLAEARQRQKRGLMQQLLTGKKRVRV